MSIAWSSMSATQSERSISRESARIRAGRSVAGRPQSLADWSRSRRLVPPRRPSLLASPTVAGSPVHAAAALAAAGQPSNLNWTRAPTPSPSRTPDDSVCCTRPRLAHRRFVWMVGGTRRTPTREANRGATTGGRRMGADLTSGAEATLRDAKSEAKNSKRAQSTVCY